MSKNQLIKFNSIIKERGITQEKAADILEIDRGTIRNKLNASPIDEAFLRVIKEKLDIDLTNEATNEPPKPATLTERLVTLLERAQDSIEKEQESNRITQEQNRKVTEALLEELKKRNS